MALDVAKYRDLRKSGVSHDAAMDAADPDYVAVGEAHIGTNHPGARAVYFGDSIIHQSGVAGFLDDATQGGTSVPMWMNAQSKGRLTPIRNAGISGNTTQQMRDRLQADVIAYDPNLVCMIAGVNDVKGGVDVATTQANLTYIFDELVKNNIYLVIGTITPSNLIDTTAKKQALFTMNRWLVEQARARRGMTVVDIYSKVADPTSTSWRSGYDADGTHQNPKGAQVIGKAFADALSVLLPTVTNRLSRSNADPYDIAPNPTMTGNTAGVATSTSIVGGGVATKVARTDGIPGEWQQVVQSSSATGFVFKDITTGFTAGEKYVPRFEVETEGVTATAHSVYAEWRDAGGGVVAGAALSCNFLEGSGAAGDFSGIFELNPTTCPATATKIRIGYRLTGTGTVRIGSMSCRPKGA